MARVGLKVRELERVAIDRWISGSEAGQAKLLGKNDVEKLRAANEPGAMPPEPDLKVSGYGRIAAFRTLNIRSSWH